MSVDEPKQESNYSQTLAEVSPRGFLAFPSKDVRGMCASKTFISIRNISKYHITYKVSARQQLRARPRQHVLAPGSRQTVEIVIDSEYIPKIEDKLYVKIYQNDSENIVNGKTEEVCFCLYETSKLALIPMQEEVFNLQQRLESMEVDVCTFTDAMGSNAWLPSITLLLLIFLICFCFYVWTVSRFVYYDTSKYDCQCSYNLEPSLKSWKKFNWYQKKLIDLFL